MTKSAVLTPHQTTNVVTSQSAAHVGRRAVRLPTAWLLFFGTLAVYFLTRTHLNTFDAVAYANQIGLAHETGKLRPLFHPHHLLFNALGFCAWRLARLAGYGGGPLIVNQTLNAGLGAFGVGLFYSILRRLQPAGAGPLLAALGLAGSFGWWICATDGRVNMPSGVLMLAAFGVLTAPPMTARRAALGGALAGAAVLFHESAGLFLLVGAAAVFAAAAKEMSPRPKFGEPEGINSEAGGGLGSPNLGRRGILFLLAYGAVWAGVVLLAYAAVGFFALRLHSFGEFKHWTNAYAERGWWWDFHILHNLRLDLFGLRHAIFDVPPGRAALAETPLHAFGTAGVGLLWLAYGAALVGLTAAALTILTALPRLRRSEAWPIVRVCLLWTALYAAFFTVWCPGAFVFWVPVLVPLGTLLVLARPAPRLLGVWVGIFALLNFGAGILPYLKPINGLSQRVAWDIKAHTPPRSLVIVAGVGDDAQGEVDIPYFASRPILSLHGLLAHAQSLPDAQTGLDKSLDGALRAGREVYVLDEIWTRRDCVKGLQKQSPGITAADLSALFGRYSLSPAWTGPRGQVWRVRGGSALTH